MFPYLEFPKEEIRDKEIIQSVISDDGNIVVIAYGIGFLAFCKTGDNAYTEIKIKGAIQDVIYHKVKFYLLDEIGRVYLLHCEEDGSHPHIQELTGTLTDNAFYGYLVLDILTDSIFVISRDVVYIGEGNDANNDTEEDANGDTDEEEVLPQKIIHFHIFRVNSNETLEESKTLKGLTKVESLSNRVLFLGHNCSIVVMASQFEGFKGNRIYFTDNMRKTHYCSPHGCRDLGVFNIKDGTVKELFADRFHHVMSPPLWVAIRPYPS